MALAASLIPGFKYRITAGPFQDEIVTIVNNTPFPDGDPHGRQRKVTVLNNLGMEVYILPRLLEDRPVAVEPTTGTVLPTLHAPVVTPEQSFVNATDPNVIAQAEQTAAVLGLVASHRVDPITDPMDPRLDPFRPSRSKVRRYIMRTMENGITDVDYLLTFTNARYRAKNEGRPANIMLKGPTQVGKTLLVEVLAIKWADLMADEQRAKGEEVTYTKPMPVFTLSGSSGVTDFDLFGQTTSYTDLSTGKESLVWLPGLAALAAEAGGILYLDESNAFGQRTTSSLHPMADHRHQFTNRNKAVNRGGVFMPEIVTVPLDLWIIGSYNEGYRGMNEMNEAFINRFRHLQWDYDKEVEAKLIGSAAIRLMGERLRLAREAKVITTPVGTSALQWVEEDIASFGIALGMKTFKGMFKEAELRRVDEILEDGSIYVMLQEEQRQREAEERAAQLQP